MWPGPEKREHGWTVLLLSLQCHRGVGADEGELTAGWNPA